MILNYQYFKYIRITLSFYFQHFAWEKKVKKKKKKKNTPGVKTARSDLAFETNKFTVWTSLVQKTFKLKQNITINNDCLNYVAVSNVRHSW